MDKTISIALILIWFSVIDNGDFVTGADVNLLWVNDKGNQVPKNVINAVFKYIEDNPNMGINVPNKAMIDGGGNDVYDAIESVCSKLGEMVDAETPPDFVLDTTKTGVFSDAIKSLTNSLGIPSISTSYGGAGELREWRELQPLQEKYLIQIRPPADVMPDAFREIVLRQNATNAAILYDDSFVLDKKFGSMLQNIPIRHIFYRVPSKAADIMKQLKGLSKVDVYNYFVLGSIETIEKVLKVGSKAKMGTNKYAWYAMSKDNVAEIKTNDLPVIYMYPMEESGNKGNINVDDIRRDLGVNIGSDVDIAFYFNVALTGIKAISTMKEKGQQRANKLIYTKCDEYSDPSPIIRENFDLMSALKNVNTESVYGPLMIGSNGKSYMDFDVRITKQSLNQINQFQVDDVATYNVGVPGSIEMKMTSEALTEFSAVTIYRIVVVEQPPFISKNADGEWEGYCIDLLKALQGLIDFEYELYEAPDKQYGRMDDNMEWNGAVRELIDENADIILGAFAVMAEREFVIDYTVPYYDLVGTSIMMKKVKTDTSLFKFLSVLEGSVWGCILAAYFVTSFLMWVFDRFSPYSYQNNMEKYKDDEEKRYFNLKECLWFCMTSLTPQGGGEAPKNLSGRLVAATWWLFGFIVIASYTANLAAFLTVSRLETPVDSLEDLAKQYKIQFSPMKGSDSMIYFERMANIEEKFYEIWKEMSLNDSLSVYERAQLAVWDYPVSDRYTKMWQTMKEAGLPKSFAEAIDRVRASPSSSEGYAFLGDATDIRYAALTNCDLQMVGEEFSRKPYALAVRQGSPLKDILNDAILKLLNQRKLEAFKENWWNKNPNKKSCEEFEEDSGGGISIYNIGGVFIVIFVGIGLAILTLVFEYVYYKDKKQSRVSTADSTAKIPVQVKEFDKQHDETKAYVPIS